MREYDSCVFKQPGSGPTGLTEAEAAAANASISVLGKNRDYLVQEIVGEIRSRLIKAYKQGNPPANACIWAWGAAHSYAKTLVRMELRCASSAAFESSFIKHLEYKKNRPAISRLLELVEIAADALTDLDDQRLYNLYYRHHLERVAAILGLSVLATVQRWYRLTKKISNAVRMMAAEDPQVYVVFPGIIGNKRLFHYFVIDLFIMVNHESECGYTVKLKSLCRKAA